MTKKSTPMGYVFYPNKPFLVGGIKIWSFLDMENPDHPIYKGGVRGAFSQHEKQLIADTVGFGPRLTLSKLRVYLAKHCNIQDPRDYTWEDIFEALKSTQGGGTNVKSPPAGDGGKIPPKWKQIKAKAENYLQSKKWPGQVRLAELLGCSRNTLRKAIKNSSILSQTQAESKPQKPKAVATFNEGHQRRESKGGDLSGPEAEAYRNEIIEKITARAGKKTDSPKDSYSELAGMPTEQLEKILSVLETEEKQYLHGGSDKVFKKL